VQLYEMFPGYPSTSGSGKIVGRLRDGDDHHGYVAQGWQSLLDAMKVAEINTPRRVAAFLTTLVFESWCEFNVLQGGSNVAAGIGKGYTGRGYIQLTGTSNYGAAGNYLGIDLMGHPELAQSLDWSAQIAAWYWTVARPSCNLFADQLRFGMINRAIGYPLAGSNDADRCMVFGHALDYLGAVRLPGETIDCTR
jgi:putative chitinase